MKKSFITIVLMAIMATLYGQQSLPVTIKSAGQNVVLLTNDSVTIDAIIPITMTSINYRCHQYDENLKLHLWSYGYRSSNECGVFDQEFLLYVSNDTYYWIYTDWCVGLMLWGGNNALPYQFRSSIQLPTSYDFK